MGETQNDILNINTKMAVCNSLGEDKGSAKGILFLTSDGVWVPTVAPFPENSLALSQAPQPAERRGRPDGGKYREQGEAMN